MVGRRGSAPAQAGHVLVFALVVVVLLTMALSLVAQLLNERQRALMREISSIELTALSDAALALTLAELATNVDFAGVENRDFGEGEIESEVHSLSPIEAEVVCRASYRGRDQSTRSRVLLGGGGPRVIEWRLETNPPLPSLRHTP